jgi:hypothetical protein
VIPTRSRFYFTENGSVINSFGGTVAAGATVSGITVTTTTTTTYTPPRVDRRFTLAAATSDSFSSTSASSVTTNFGGAPTNTSTAQNITINFAGQETVTVPAGTFVACKFLETINSDTNEQWYAKGSGAPIKYTSRTSEGQAITLSMTSASRLNGCGHRALRAGCWPCSHNRPVLGRFFFRGITALRWGLGVMRYARRFR